MNKTATALSMLATHWLRNEVFPLWTRAGVDSKNGGFIENLSFEGKPRDLPRRAMVQSRQIYSFVTGVRLGSLPEKESREILEKALRFFETSYLRESGACAHAVHPDGRSENESHELYTQAFAIFALANAFGFLKDSRFEDEALKLLAYLKRERRGPHGGYTEIKDGKTLFQSNPHMHLFEAALAWMEVSSRAEWKDLAKELHTLCMERFVDPETGLLAEHFDETWKPQRQDGKFIAEPGHHFEWAWLLAVHQELSGIDSKKVRHRLYELATGHGVDRETHFAYDEIWSDFSPKKTSSRFWPHCERVKAAVKLGAESDPAVQPEFAKAADEALQVLNLYLQTPVKGLWFDTKLETGDFNAQEPKASSLYHIINAIAEYVRLRPALKD